LGITTTGHAPAEIGMAISPVSPGFRMPAFSPEPPAAPERVQPLVARAAPGGNGPPQAPPTRLEIENVLKVLQRLGEGTPPVSEGDIQRLVLLDRALQRAKDNNAKSGGPKWTGPVGQWGPAGANAAMNGYAVGLKRSLVRAAFRVEAAEAGYRKVEHLWPAGRDLHVDQIAQTRGEAVFLNALRELQAAHQALDRARNVIDAKIQTGFKPW
jgi:hypothetical protein